MISRRRFFVAGSAALIDSLVRAISRYVADADGIATVDGSIVGITELGRPLMRTVCALFDTYLDSGVGKHSQAV